MSEMRGAIAGGLVMLVHQPKFSFRTRTIEGVECLVRWRHPTHGLVAPDMFVPMAEETGNIRVLTDWVLKRAIEDQSFLIDSGWPLTMSVNISAGLLSDAVFAQSAVATAALARGKLCFEITETAAIGDPAAALNNVAMFAENGISIAIDDYGAGFSVDYLRQLPAQELKLDKSLVQNMIDSERDRALVSSIIELAHGLGLKVTAEGVEQSSAFALLASMSCDMAQGHLIAGALSREDLIALLVGFHGGDLFPAAQR